MGTVFQNRPGAGGAWGGQKGVPPPPPMLMYDASLIRALGTAYH